MPVQPALFALMTRYGSTPTSAPYELKVLVKALHSRGMECILGKSPLCAALALCICALYIFCFALLCFAFFIC